jgi:putative phosphoribosyl transferase
VSAEGRSLGGEAEVSVVLRDVALEGVLEVPAFARGVVVFAHGSGSGRHSPRNREVARALAEAGLATLLLDLLTPAEEHEDLRTRRVRFDVGLLAERVAGAIEWLGTDARTARLGVGCFGASTGAAAALIAAAERPDRVRAVVSRGGRPDLAGGALPRVAAPTLLIVGGNDPVVVGLNREALERLGAPRRLEVVPGAGHLFEEPGTLAEVARLAREWFLAHLGHAPERPPEGVGG